MDLAPVLRNRATLPGEEAVHDATQRWLSRLRGDHQQSAEPQWLHAAGTAKQNNSLRVTPAWLQSIDLTRILLHRSTLPEEEAIHDAQQDGE